MKIIYENGEPSNEYCWLNNMRLSVSNGQENINIKHEKIGQKLTGQTSVQFRRIRRNSKFGCFGIKQRWKSTHLRMSEARQGMETSFKWYGGVSLAISLVQLYFSTELSTATYISTFSRITSFLTLIYSPMKAYLILYSNKTMPAVTSPKKLAIGSTKSWQNMGFRLWIGRQIHLTWIWLRTYRPTSK